MSLNGGRIKCDGEFVLLAQPDTEAESVIVLVECCDREVGSCFEKSQALRRSPLATADVRSLLYNSFGLSLFRKRARSSSDESCSENPKGKQKKKVARGKVVRRPAACIASESTSSSSSEGESANDKKGKLLLRELLTRR